MPRPFARSLLICCVALIAPMLRAQEPAAQDWIDLFDGKSLSGWTAKENPAAFRVEDGILIVKGERGHLYYTGPVNGGRFENFVFEAEVMTTKGSNGGIFFHTAVQESGWPAQGYESQVNATQGDPIKTGSLYGVVNLERPGHEDDQWYRHTITVKGKHVLVAIEGRTVIDWVEPEGVRGSRKLSSGTFALQAHDPQSLIKFRRIRVRPLPTENSALSRAERRLLRPGNGWWNEMDYGPFLCSTVEIDAAGTQVLKGFTVELDPKLEWQATFDSDLLRYGAVFKGPLQLKGVTFDGSHGGNPRVRGDVLYKTGNGPGVSLTPEFADPRESPHGPLPAEIARYSGLYRHGDRVVFAYEVKGRSVLDSMIAEALPATLAGTGPTLVNDAPANGGGHQAIVRSLEVGPGDQSLFFRLADFPKNSDMRVSGRGKTTLVTITQEALAEPYYEERGEIRVGRDRSDTQATMLAAGAPSKLDAAHADAADAVSFRYVPEVGRPHPRAGAVDLTLPRLNDGQDARNADDVLRTTWFDGRAFRIVADMGRLRTIERVDTYSWHVSNRAPQLYALYGHADREAPATAADLREAGFVHLGDVDTRNLGEGGRHVASVAGAKGALGRFAQLVFVLSPVSNQEGVFLTEIDIWTDEHPAPALKPKAFRAHPEMSPLAFEISNELVRSVRVSSGEGSDTKSLIIEVPASDQVARVRIAAMDLLAAATPSDPLGDAEPRFEDLQALTKPGSLLWPERIPLEVKPGRESKGPFAVDDIPVPMDNPYGSNMRIGGFDFFKDGDRAAVCTWNGDVWIVSGLAEEGFNRFTWKRFASGLFETLGLKIVNDQIYVNGKDQITRLHDLNGDGEADYYENFCNLVKTTRNFHEFTFDLQTDSEGRFYFTKGAPVRGGGRGFEEIVPHHGTVLRASADGRSLEVYATGLRAPNGLGISPTGQVTTGDNEGTWVPHCKLHWMREGSFHGVVDTAHTSERPTSYELPLLWFPMEVDNSSGAQVWVTSDRFSDLKGEMLHLSYGQSAIYRVLRDPDANPVQGAVVRLPARLGSSAMRGRFHPKDGQLYVCGLRGWQTNAARLTAFQRIRATGEAHHLPIGFDARADGIELRFAEPLDAELASDPKSYTLRWWNYVWGPQYGSPELSADAPDEELLKRALEQELHGTKNRDKVAIASVRLSQDKKTVFLVIPTMKPVMQFELGLDLETADGEAIRTKVIGTIHEPRGSSEGGR